MQDQETALHWVFSLWLRDQEKESHYFAGDGVKEWEPKNELISNDINITAASKKFRDRNIQAAEASKNMNDVRILSLSFIFPLDKVEKDRSITYHMRGKVVDSLVSLASLREVQFPAVPKEAILYCFDQSDRKKDEYNPDNLMGKYIKELVAQYNSLNNAYIRSTSEASFMNEHLMPFLNTILINQNFEHSIYSMIDGYDIDGKKPDFMFGLKNKHNEIYFFFVEVKRPLQESKYQAESDFVKLMKQMKSSLDFQYQMGLRDPFSLGLLCEGFRCSLFKMRWSQTESTYPFCSKDFFWSRRQQT